MHVEFSWYKNSIKSFIKSKILFETSTNEKKIKINISTFSQHSIFLPPKNSLSLSLRTVCVCNIPLGNLFLHNTRTTKVCVGKSINVKMSVIDAKRKKQLWDFLLFLSFLAKLFVLLIKEENFAKPYKLEAYCA